MECRIYKLGSNDFLIFFKQFGIFVQLLKLLYDQYRLKEMN